MNVLRSFFIVITIGLVAAATIFAAPPSFALAQTATSSGATSSNPNANVAAAVQSYFADIPVMIAIAKCESGPRQFAANGGPLYAGTGSLMVGIFQIDSAIHTAPAIALGFDITTVVGNMGYARYLYGKEGTEPWISSFGCWGSATNASGASSTGPASATVALTETLSLGEIDPQVLILQQMLNQTGFTLATSGPGSPGNETDKFGALTYAALKKFQCAQGIVCSGDEATTGYGLLNAPTRAALLAMVATPTNSVATAATNATPTTTAPVIIVAIAPSSSSAVLADAGTAAADTDTDNAAELASLQSRVAALVVIVNQLEAELAARI